LCLALVVVLVAAAADGRAVPAGPTPLVIRASGITGAVAVGVGSVWIADASEGRLVRADAGTGRVRASLPIGDRDVLVRGGCGAANVHSFTTGEFGGRRCDLPSGVALGAGSLWVARNDDRTLLRLDPRTDRVIATIATGAFAFAVAASRDAVWVADFENDELVRVDPRTNRVVATLRD